MVADTSSDRPEVVEGDGRELQDAWQVAVAEQLRAKYPSAQEAFRDLQGWERYRKTLKSMKQFIHPLDTGNQKRNESWFQAYSTGLFHFQNPHLGPGHRFGTSDATFGIRMHQNVGFRLYAAGLLHFEPDRILTSAMQQGLEHLMRQSGMDCTPDKLRRMFDFFDASDALTRDGTLFVNDFARLFKHGKDSVDVALQEVATASLARDKPAGSKLFEYTQYKLSKHQQAAKKKIEAEGRKASRAHRRQRMGETLLHRLREEITFLSTSSDAIQFPGHGGDQERRDLEFQINLSIEPKDHRGTPDATSLTVKVEIGVKPSAGPALALAALDSCMTGLLSVEMVRLGLEQCGVKLSATDLHLLVRDYLEAVPDGKKVRWVELLEDLGGLPPSVLKLFGDVPLSATIGRSPGRVDAQAVMAELQKELTRWESAARRAMEVGEQRFTEGQELASQLVFSPAGIRKLTDNAVRFYWALDDESLTAAPRVHVNLVAQPAVHVFLRPHPTAKGAAVKVRVLLSEDAPGPVPADSLHPIFDASLVRLVSTACLERWERLRSMCKTYAAGSMTNDPMLLTLKDLKYVFLSALKGTSLSTTQVQTLMAAYPGPASRDKAAKISIGTERFSYYDLLVELSPALADLVGEKESLGSSMRFPDDETDPFAQLCLLSAAVFPGYLALRKALEAAGPDLTPEEVRDILKEVVGVDAEGRHLDWALRFLHGPRDRSINGRAIMHVVAASMARYVSSSCQRRPS